MSKCKALQMSEVSEPEFVRACSLDGELGTTAVSIYRGFIGCWSFMYERWESGAFFTQTKPPKGNTSHRYFHCIREIMMGVGNRVASVIMLTFPSEPCPHADFSK